jgi:predicted glycosyltransferase
VLNKLRDAGAQSVVLPRTPQQREQLLEAGGFIIPERAIDAQSLIAYADLMISAGGTMNREAVALGTPVFTSFEGRLGAVDEELIADGRLRRLTDPGEVVIAKRPRGEGNGARPDRIRRDPRDFAQLLAAPVGGI